MKTVKYLKTFAIVLLAFLLAFLFSSNYKSEVLAQANISLSVFPPISYLQVPPGTTRNHTVVLENTSNQTIIVMPSIVDFSSDGKTGRAIISNELSFPYISFGTTKIKELSIPAHKKAQLTLYIDVPKDAIEKEYPLTVLFFSKNDNHTQKIDTAQTTSTRSEISGGIGSNLIVLVSKESKLAHALKIISLDTPRFVDSFRGIEFLPLVKNESISSLSASGSAEILNWKKSTVSEFEIYPDVILGSSTRELRALRPGSALDKPETGTFSYQPKFLLGPYQIVVNLENSSAYIEVIYAFPFSIIFVAIVGIIVASTYLKKIKSA